MIGKLNEKSGERYRSPFPIELAELLRNFILSGPAGFCVAVVELSLVIFPWKQQKEASVVHQQMGHVYN